MKTIITVLGLALGYLWAWAKGWRYCIAPLIICLLLGLKGHSQSAKLIRDYKKLPLTDTAYLFIEKKFNDSDGGVTIWQQDLQTGYRYESRCTCPKESLPKIGTVARTLRSKLIIEPKNKKRD